MTEPDSPSKPGVTNLVAQRRHAALFFTTGVGLVVHVLFDIPLLLSIVIVFVAACLLVFALRSDDVQLGEWSGRSLVRAGLIASPFALVAYDGSRFLLTHVFGFDVAPWAALPHFGSALIGEHASFRARWIAGFMFHVANGVGFSVAFSIVCRNRGVLLGIAWGLGLEACMLGIYPSWLQIKQLQEFTTMSLMGHVCFGAALGYVVKRVLDHERFAR